MALGQTLLSFLISILIFSTLLCEGYFGNLNLKLLIWVYLVKWVVKTITKISGNGQTVS